MTRNQDFFHLPLEGMDRLAESILGILKTWSSPGVVLLQGEMGSGKTTLVRLVLEKLGVKEDVNSPSFAIMNEYFINKGDVWEERFYHFDFYRLESESELDELGFEEIWGKEGHSFIEWYDKFSLDFPGRKIFVQWKESDDPGYRNISMVVE